MSLIKRSVAGALIVGAVGLGSVYWLGTRDDLSTGSTQTQGDAGAQIEQGRYLARVGNCMGCHTVKGGQAYAGGAVIPTPFGAFFGPNITPDTETGIGSWSADDFWQALHNGKAKNGDLLYPAFPFTDYTRINRADSDAIYAYLLTVTPVRQANRPHELDFPYNQRTLMAGWRALYFSPGVQENEAGESEQWNRGRYLVNGLGHCAACHAPRNGLGAIADSAGLTGGVIPGLGWYAPALTQDRQAGLGAWSAADIASLLKTGIAAHSTASGPMAEVVQNSTQYLNDADATAIGVYLASLPATPPALQNQTGAPSAAVQELGGKLYTQHCVQCHQASGEGSGKAWPALSGNLTVTAPSPLNAIRVVLDGGYAPATADNPRPHGMPPFAHVLSDNDIAMLVSYIRNSWGNQAGGVMAMDVKQARAASTAN